MQSITNIINFSIHSRIRTTNTHSNIANVAFEIYINKVVNGFKIIILTKSIIIIVIVPVLVISS